jgi:hypothetical protein
MGVGNGNPPKRGIMDGPGGDLLSIDFYKNYAYLLSIVSENRSSFVVKLREELWL